MQFFVCEHSPFKGYTRNKLPVMTPRQLLFKVSDSDYVTTA